MGGAPEISITYWHHFKDVKYPSNKHPRTQANLIRTYERRPAIGRKLIAPD
jgi:hypothetical protein